MSKVIRANVRSARIPNSFSPTSIANLKVWLLGTVGVFSDAGTTPATNNDAVQQWNDQSGNGNNVAQATLGNRPIFKTSILNGKPIIRFDGTDDYIEKIYSGVLAQPSTIFVVVNMITAAGAVFDGTDCTNRNLLGPSQLSVGPMTLHAGSGFEAETEPAPSGFLIFSCILNGASSELFKNGVSQGTGDAGAAGAGGLRLGSNCNLTGTLEMDLAEILVYNALLTASERLSVEQYLSGRYGI